MAKISLPIDSHLKNIIDKIFSMDPVILNASPGSGKTTRVPAEVLQNLMDQKNSKKMIVIVPKRISALSAATRIAEENNWQIGNQVGYMVRFESKLTSQTQLIFMTDGLFLKKYTDQSFMKQVGYIFLDEFHERKSSMDLILGVSLEQKILYGNLQIIVMSATMDVQQLKKYFGQAHTIEIQAPPYKVEKVYTTTTQRLTCDKDFFEQLKMITLDAWSKAKKDILIFLPGMREIQKAIEVLKPCLPQAQLEVLHGSLSLEDQRKIVEKNNLHRRIVLATNVAESSITLPDLDCVIDSGLEKNVQVEKKIGFSRLKLDRISVFSATQREGRAARTNDGLCFKLWHPFDERSMPMAIRPEILDSSLHLELLFLASCGIQDFESFSWLETPKKNFIQRAAQDLVKWKLLSPKNEITNLGRLVAASPVDIVNSVLFIELLKDQPLEFTAELIARLDDVVGRSAHSPKTNYANDLERLFDSPLSHTQAKLKTSLTRFAQEIKVPSNQTSAHSLSFLLFKIFSQYFPHRIVAKKSSIQGLSSAGRGVELSSESCAHHFDFYAALSGFEKSDAVTVINFGVGVAKAEALKILTEYSHYENNIFFDETSEVFFKQETLYFGSFKLNEKSKERLSAADLNFAWKKYVTEAPESFLNLNQSYHKNKVLIQFIENKTNELKLEESLFYFKDGFALALAQKLTENIESFEDFKNCDVYYYLKDIVTDKIYQLLAQLPKNIKLPSGKQVPINYEDPKAPLISAKIQDFFGWNETPKLADGRLSLTLELLAPNMRPAQTTSDLGYFWKNSYVDVRKDLRARYPKHSWPEDPTQT
jgi:ATP-dependent helicase HrpB